MSITRRHAHGLPYDSYSLRALRAVDHPRDVRMWPGLNRSGNYERANRLDSRVGALPHRGGVQHIAVTAEFLRQNTPDQSAENVTAWGLNPRNRAASWHDTIDRDSWVPYLPPWTRPWVQGVAGAPVDANSVFIGQEMGILSTDWRSKPDWFVLAQLRMSAAAWALYVHHGRWPLEVILNRAALFERMRSGRPIGFTEHWVLDPGNRHDAGRWPHGSNITTFPWHKRHWGGPGLLPLIQEELAIRAGAIPGTPDLPATPSADVKAIQEHLNFLGAHLDVDGYWGPLTLAVAHDYADVYGYRGDVTNHRALLTHLESTMQNVLTAIEGLSSKIDALPRLVSEHPYAHPHTGERSQAAAYAAFANTNAHRAHRMATQAVTEAAALRGAVEGLLEVVSELHGIDTEAVTKAVEDGVAAAISRVEADVRLVLTTTDTEPQED